jgi:hypothetical protein
MPNVIIEMPNAIVIMIFEMPKMIHMMELGNSN